jgi:gliding motility-associated-like protein
MMKIRLLVLFFLINVIRVYGQCSLSVNVTSTNNVICSGSPVKLIATASAGMPGYIYAWSTGETTASINVNKGGTYSVSVSDNTPGCQPVVKSITVTEGTTPSAPTVSDVYGCLNSPVTISASGSGGTYQWYDAQTGGNFLGSGSSYTTPPIKGETTFYVETTLNGCPSARSALTVRPYVTFATGGVACPGSQVVLTAGGAQTYDWYDAPGGNHLGTGSSFTTPVLNTTTKFYVVGTTDGCANAPVEATATIYAIPVPPTSPNVSTCYGSVATLHATSSTTTDVFDWYATPTGGTSLITSTDYTTPVLTASTTYYVQITTTRGCTSTRTPVTVTVNPIPTVPTAPDVVTCAGSRALLSVTNPSGDYNWYATPTATTRVSSGSTYNTPVLNASTDFYVASVSGSCISARTKVHVTVNQSPTAPTAPGQTICSGSAAVLTALGPGGDYSWYSVATGGTPLLTGVTFTTPVLTANKTYYVETNVAGCISPRTAVLVKVNPTPAPPNAADASICAGSKATLVATGTGTSFEWYDVPTGGTPISTNSTLVTPVLTSTTTYYVQNIDNTCISPRKAVTVTVNTTPSPPTAAGKTICAGNTANLNAVGSGTIDWFESAAGGTSVFTGSSFTTPALTATTNYYVQASNGTCASSRTLVKVTVTSTANQFSYASSTYCTAGTTNPVPTITVPGGTFSATPAGLDISSGTGEIMLATSTAGEYTVTYANGCVLSTQKIYIVVTPNAAFTYNATVYCQNSTNPSPVFTPLSTAGVFTASPAGLVFTSNKSGVINLKTSTPGTYTVTNTIDAIGGCPMSTASAIVKIDEGVTVVAGPNQTVARGEPVQLAGSVSGAVTTGTWSGGAGFFSNTTDPNAIYTPTPGETSAVLTLTSADPGTSCGPQAKSVTITFSPRPAAPVVPGASICAGNATILSVTTPAAGAHNWYDVATGGTSINTGTSFTTPILNNTTVYYVDRTVSGITSNRTAVTVTVTPIPVAPTVDPVAPVCYGTQAMLTAHGSGGAYEWYDQPTGGSLLFTGAIYKTQFLTINTSFYVQENSSSCVSPTRTRVDVTVNPVPSITSTNTGTVCSGTPLNYTMTANLAGTTYTYSRNAVAGISNPAVANQPATSITETLINTTGTNINVTYAITPNLNGCDGVPFNYIVTVYPTPIVTSSSADPGCSGNSVNYTIKFNVTNTPVSWSRAPVPGISNPPVSNQVSNKIQEILTNTTNAPINVDYIFSYGTADCGNSTFKYTVAVNPRVVISSGRSGQACSGIAQNYVITSQVPTAVYSWSRPAVTGISNAANTTVSSVIDEALVNTTSQAITVIYSINVVSNGCLPSAFKYTVTVYPEPTKPAAFSNSPVCTGNTIKLLTPPTAVKGGSYYWTGPNGFTSTQQNPVIANVTSANQGTYNLYILANNCQSIPTPVNVLVDAVPIVNAGPDIPTCFSSTSVQLAGTVGGGTTTGVWTTSGTGTFQPSAATLDAQYQPSAQDVASGSVTLTLASTSKDDCTIATDEMKITFTQVPATDAGPDDQVCSQANSIQLNGKMIAPYNGTWTSTGTGSFSPSATQSVNGNSPVYILSTADKNLSSIKFMLTSNNSDPCYTPSDEMIANILPPPTVDAGPEKFLLKGNTTKLTPTVSDPSVTYKWSPAAGLDDVNIKNPTVTGDADIIYTLTVTDIRGCVSTDMVSVKIAPKITMTNTFTPNGDGINDLWEIPGLIAYVDATVDIFDRSGQKVFHSVGYSKPWDGTYNGKELPFGTYYYIIDTKITKPVLTGYITIIK